MQLGLLIFRFLCICFSVSLCLCGSLFFLLGPRELRDVEPIGADAFVQNIDLAVRLQVGERLAHLGPPDRRENIGIVFLEPLVLFPAGDESIGLGSRQALPTLGVRIGLLLQVVLVGLRFALQAKGVLPGVVLL